MHVPPEKSQNNTDSAVQHEFDNPLYAKKEGPTNDYSAPWDIHSRTPMSKPPPVKAVEESKPHEYNYTANEGPTAVYDYAETPTTPTKLEKTQLMMSDVPARLPPCTHACEPVYDDAIPFSLTVDGQQPTYNCAESSVTEGVLPQHMYDYAESPAAHPSGSPQVVYDYAESPVAHVSTNGGFPGPRVSLCSHQTAHICQHGAMHAAPGAEEHYEMMPTQNGVGSSHHHVI